LKLGIIGFASSGKTCLFNALTEGKSSEAGSHSSRPNIGIAKVKDERIDFLSRIYNPLKKTYATVEFVDVPEMLNKESANTQNFSQFLHGVDALIIVVRNFDDPSVPNPKNRVDPKLDFSEIVNDLIFNDLILVERRIEKLERSVRLKKDRDEVQELELLRRIQVFLEEGKVITKLDLTEEEKNILKGFDLQSSKPFLPVINISEDQLIHSKDSFENIFSEFEIEPITLCVKLEEELSQMSKEDQELFLKDYNIDSPAKDTVIKSSFQLLDLDCFLTVGEDEVRSWPIVSNSSILKAAGTIHSDLERGFIRAEVISYNDFVECGSMSSARKKGVLRLEGKKYKVSDGDIVNIRFNV
tara:strand:- start:20075 stop:21142 length:1068 start_codon:yes stop_codon:yes gene_type:complete